VTLFARLRFEMGSLGASEFNSIRTVSWHLFCSIERTGTCQEAGISNNNTSLYLCFYVLRVRCFGATAIAHLFHHSHTRNFLWEIARDFVATKYLSASAASSPPAPSSARRYHGPAIRDAFQTLSGQAARCSPGHHVDVAGGMQASTGDAGATLEPGSRPAGAPRVLVVCWR